MTTTSTDGTQATSTGALRNRLYTEAMSTLRSRHEDEFTQIVEAKYAEHGLTYHRRLNEEQKAERQIRDLIAKHPGLVAKFGGNALDTPAQHG